MKNLQLFQNTFFSYWSYFKFRKPRTNSNWDNEPKATRGGGGGDGMVRRPIQYLPPRIFIRAGDNKINKNALEYLGGRFDRTTKLFKFFLPMALLHQSWESFMDNVCFSVEYCNCFVVRMIIKNKYRATCTYRLY